MAIAEAAVADDALGGLLALLEGASRLARRHYGGERERRWRREDDAEAIRGLEREVRIVEDKEAEEIQIERL